MAPRHRSGIIAALDIGSSKVCCLIAEVEEGRAPRVVGYGQHAAHGMKRGMVVDMDQTETAIREAVHQAEDMAGVSVSSVVVNIGGVHLNSQMIDSLVVLNQHDITDEDLQKVTEVACAKQLEGDRQIIHAIPAKYLLDNQTDIRDPRGMTGSRLEADVHIVSGTKTGIRNVVRCVERCHLEVEDIIVSGYASAESCLVDDEKELGVCLVDIGGGTCDIAIYDEGKPVYFACVPVGGWHITSDIARGLSTPLNHAERIKTLYGCAMASLVDANESIEVPHVGEDDDNATNRISRGALAGIIQPRCEEILELVREKIEQTGLESTFGRRVVLTGGASQLLGFRQLAEVVLDKSVRLARPIGLEGLTDISGGPNFATAAGLILRAHRSGRNTARRKSAEGKAFNSLWTTAKNWLKDSFQTS